MSIARRTDARAVQLGGSLLLLAGVIILMSIITAETQYPTDLHYSTRTNEISNLGAARPPHRVTAEPSAIIFNSAMKLAGAMIAAGAILAYEAHRSKVLAACTLLLGTGIIGVGIFPETHPHIHQVFTMVTFIFGGLSAVCSFAVTRGAFRYLALLLGLTSLICLATGEKYLLPVLGAGGAERWVAYPVVLWLTGYGGYVLGSAGNRRE